MDANEEFFRRAEAGDGLFAVAWAMLRLTTAIHALGNADAATPMGAIEAFGAHLGEKIDSAATTIAEAIEAAELPSPPTPHRKRAPARKGPLS